MQSGHKVLIVDTDLDNIKKLKSLFSEKKIKNITVLDDPESGIEFAWKSKPDIIITNKKLKKINGIDFAGIIKKTMLKIKSFSITTPCYLFQIDGVLKILENLRVFF